MASLEVSSSNFPHGAFGSEHIRRQACGENLRKYGTRMDAIWSFREAYNEARNVMSLQDSYCERAEAGLWNELSGDFPDSYKWEALVDVLRGRVRVSRCINEVPLERKCSFSGRFPTTAMKRSTLMISSEYVCDSAQVAIYLITCFISCRMNSSSPLQAFITRPRLGLCQTSSSARKSLVEVMRIILTQIADLEDLQLLLSLLLIIATNANRTEGPNLLLVCWHKMAFLLL